MQEARFYQTLKDNEIKCELCNHFCVIKKGKTGICGARKNIGGKLLSLTYGYPIDVDIDPVEKKPFFHFLPGTQTYSIGSIGCNFACANCHNWSRSQTKKTETIIERFDYVSPEKIVIDAVGDSCKSIAYTYNEPTISTEYILEIMRLAHEAGLKNAWVSNGFMSKKCLNAILPYLDAINVDLKSFDNSFYEKICHAQLKPILENLKLLKQEQVHVEIATLLIPTLSTEIKMIKEMVNFIALELDTETPWHVLRFSPEISWRLKTLNQTGDDVVYEACEIGKNAGLKYVYVGNIPGDQKENTYCPKCGELLIRRLGYHIERLDNKGLCPNCENNLDIIE